MTQSIATLLGEYRRLADSVVNYEFYNLVALTHHSTALEGSLLTLNETHTLLEKGLTAGGKPLEHHLMVTDHHQALTTVLRWAEAKTEITPERIQQLGSLVMDKTGYRVKAPGGIYDIRRGEWRKGGVRAGSHIFPDYHGVPHMVEKFCQDFSQRVTQASTVDQVYTAAFDAHFAFVSIHPFGDGNGRTSRLLMNYVQHYHGQPLSLVFVQHRNAYVKAIEASREVGSTGPIRKFLYAQLARHLRAEIKFLTIPPRSLPKS